MRGTYAEFVAVHGLQLALEKLQIRLGDFLLRQLLKMLLIVRRNLGATFVGSEDPDGLRAVHGGVVSPVLLLSYCHM